MAGAVPGRQVKAATGVSAFHDFQFTDELSRSGISFRHRMFLRLALKGSTTYGETEFSEFTAEVRSGKRVGDARRLSRCILRALRAVQGSGDAQEDGSQCARRVKLAARADAARAFARRDRSTGRRSSTASARLPLFRLSSSAVNPLSPALLRKRASTTPRLDETATVTSRRPVETSPALLGGPS